MLIIERKPKFIKTISKIKNEAFKRKVKKQIKKIIDNPEIPKHMRYLRKGTREVYIESYRLSYSFQKNKIIFLDLYHKDKQ